MRRAGLVVVAVAALAACGAPDPEPTRSTLQVTVPGDTPPAARPPSSLAAPAPATTGMPSTAASPTTSTAATATWRSRWWPGSHRLVTPFGCAHAPDLHPAAQCHAGQGLHHGVDVDLPCGTIVTAGVAGQVVPSSRPGAPGPAYGPSPVRLRTADGRWDVILGHTRRVLAAPGTPVVAGTPLAETGDLGAPQGCHLHVEVRAAGGPVSTAVDPRPWLGLTPGGAS